MVYIKLKLICKYVFCYFLMVLLFRKKLKMCICLKLNFSYFRFKKKFFYVLFVYENICYIKIYYLKKKWCYFWFYFVIFIRNYKLIFVSFKIMILFINNIKFIYLGLFYLFDSIMLFYLLGVWLIGLNLFIVF